MNKNIIIYRVQKRAKFAGVINSPHLCVSFEEAHENRIVVLNKTDMNFFCLNCLIAICFTKIILQKGEATLIVALFFVVLEVVSQCKLSKILHHILRQCQNIFCRERSCQDVLFSVINSRCPSTRKVMFEEAKQQISNYLRE